MAAAYSHGNSQTRDSVAAMYRATSDDRGTVQALAREVDEATEDGTYRHSCYCLLIDVHLQQVDSHSAYLKRSLNPQ